MKKDLKIPKVTGVELAAVPRENDELWDIYLINRNGFALKNVLISSSGYGDGKKTSTLRHLIEIIDARSYARIEPIQKEVFHLTNQYWVSYFANDLMYDKKFYFSPNTIKAEFTTHVQGFDLRGVLLQ